jgi:hypothetical protein
VSKAEISVVGSIASNPNLAVFATVTLALAVWQFVPAKRRSDPSRLILYGFGAIWVVVLVYATTDGHTRQMLVPVVMTVCAMFAGLLKWKVWNDWARRKYGGTKIVFDDPYGGSGSPDGGPGSEVAPPPMAAAGWFADTTARHQLRYWDGSRWTENVADNGATAVDPVA